MRSRAGRLGIVVTLVSLASCGSSGASKAPSGGSGAAKSAATTTSSSSAAGVGGATGTSTSASTSVTTATTSASVTATSTTSASSQAATSSSTSTTASTSASTAASTAASSSGAGGGTTTGKWVVGYYASWTEPQNGGNYPVSAIDWSGLTHVAAAFYLPDGKGGWASGTFDATTAAALIAAAHANGKKAIASIGGANSGAMFEGSTKAANLTTFVGNLEALIAMGYDGIDIDWEGGNLGASGDQPLETSLIMALRSKSPNVILTLTTGIENENLLDDLSWYGTIAAELDQINIMSYGMAGAWQGWESWHSSPLHWNTNSATPVGIDASVKHYLAAGVPAAKLGVGSGFYGECYTAPVTGPVQKLNGSQVSASDGAISYTNIMQGYYASSAYHYDAQAEARYLTLSGNNAQKCTYLTYEDATSIAAKGSYVKANGLGGVIIWELAEGFVSCGASVADQNPLLEAMKSSFLQ